MSDRNICNNLESNLRDNFDSHLRLMRSNNHYAIFFDNMINEEFLVKLAEAHEETVRRRRAGEKSNFVYHEFPSQEKIFSDLQLYMNGDDHTYLNVDDDQIPKTASVESMKQLYELGHGMNAEKESWLVKKIMQLAKNYVEEIEKIHEETGIPLISLHQIHAFMTSAIELLDAFREHNQRIDDFLKVSIPNTIPLNERSDFLLNISNRIHNLLLECYWVVHILAAVEIGIITASLEKFGLEVTKNYLFETTVYPALEGKVLNIKTTDDLIDYLHIEFWNFLQFLPELDEFLTTHMEMFARRDMKVKKSIEQHSNILSLRKQAMTKDGIDKIQEQAFSILFTEDNPDSTDNGFSEFLSDDELDDGLSEKELFDQGDEHDYGDSYLGDRNESGYYKDQIKRGQYKKGIARDEEYRKSIESEKMSFRYDIDSEFGTKMIKGLLATYRLQGNPETPIKYLNKILDHISRSVIATDIDAIIKDRYHISARTRRQYKKDFESGKVHTSAVTKDPDGKINFNDLELEHIDEIYIQKEQHKKHQMPGYLSQRELINKLLDDNFIRDFNEETGLKFKKYSPPTLLKKLQTLIRLNKISVLKTKSACHYKDNEDNFYNIAREIIKLSDNQR